MDDDIKILHNSINKKFYCIISEKECLVEYELIKSDSGNNIMDIYHTFVPIEFRGQGIAKKLYNKLIEYIIEHDLKVRPTCSYALKIFSEDKFEKYVEK